MFSFPTLLSMIFDGKGLFFVFFSCFFGWLVGFWFVEASAFLCAVGASCFPFLKHPGLRGQSPGPGVSLAGSLRWLRREGKGRQRTYLALSSQLALSACPLSSPLSSR